MTVSNAAALTTPAITPDAVLMGGLDFVAVVGLDGVTAERPCATFGEAMDLVLEAKRRGAEEAYVDERPVRA